MYIDIYIYIYIYSCGRLDAGFAPRRLPRGRRGAVQLLGERFIGFVLLIISLCYYVCDMTYLCYYLMYVD